MDLKHCPIAGACHFGCQTARIRRRQRTLRQLTVAQELPQAWETGENAGEIVVFQVTLQVFNLKKNAHICIYIYIFIVSCLTSVTVVKTISY